MNDIADLLSTIEKNIQDAGGTKTPYQATEFGGTAHYPSYVLEANGKKIKIRYEDNILAMPYDGNDFSCGWIWIEIFERRKGLIFTTWNRIAFIRSPGSGHNDADFEFSRKESLQLKKILWDEFNRRKNNHKETVMNSI